MSTTREPNDLLCEATEPHQQGCLDEAEDRYSRLLDWNPGCFDALNRLAIVALQRGHFSEALSRVDRALPVKPDSARAACNRGRILIALKGREAFASDVDPAHLVFAGPAQKLADLFIDTWPHNGGPTASDALRAGLPVLTMAGRSYAVRMAGSLLHAIGLPGLITHSPEAYEALALRLAREPALLGGVRQN